MNEFEKDDQLYTNLVTILKLFKNRPYHLAKYLIENKAFDQKFINRIIESAKLSEMSDPGGKSVAKVVYFIDISQMSDHFNSFLDPLEPNKSTKEITKELNDKLDQYLKDEKYEDAIRIRDYMTKHNIKRIIK